MLLSDKSIELLVTFDLAQFASDGDQAQDQQMIAVSTKTVPKGLVPVSIERNPLDKDVFYLRCEGA